MELFEKYIILYFMECKYFCLLIFVFCSNFWTLHSYIMHYLEVLVSDHLYIFLLSATKDIFKELQLDSSFSRST